MNCTELHRAPNCANSWIKSSARPKIWEQTVRNPVNNLMIARDCRTTLLHTKLPNIYVKIFSQHAHNIQFAEWSSMSSAKSGSRPAAFTCAFSSFLALNIGSCCLLQNAVYPNSKLISTISTRQDHLAELQAQPFAQSTRTFTIQFVRQVNTESVEKLEKTVCLT